MSLPKSSLKFAAGTLEPKRYANVCTCHVTKEDADALDTVSSPGLVYTYEEGALIDAELALHWSSYNVGTWSDAFLNICRLAKAEGFRYVRFDADAEIYEELEKFNW